MEYKNRALTHDKFREIRSVIAENPADVINKFCSLTKLGERFL
jgi:hypothetical protein